MLENTNLKKLLQEQLKQSEKEQEATATQEIEEKQKNQTKLSKQQEKKEEEEVTQEKNSNLENSNIGLPTLKKQENRKPYPFTLKPSVRKKITKLANENGYKSASAFVNDIFEGL